jgi:phosphohistidine swiveling domain-containing protein
VTSPAPARLCSWDNDPNPAYNFYTTGNVEEIVPGVATPFVATFFHDSDAEGIAELHRRFGVEDLMQSFPPPISNFVSVFGGRFALNLAWANAVIATWQIGDGSGLMEQFITTDKADVSSGALADRERAARQYVRVHRYFWPRAVRNIDSSSARFEKLRAEQARLDLTKLSDRALWRYLQRLRKQQLMMYATHLGVSGAAGEYASMTGKLLAAELGDRFNEGMVAGLTSGLGEVESARPGFELWKLGRFVRSKPALAKQVASMTAAEIDRALENPPGDDWKAFARRFQRFIADYGYRGQSEADPSMPSWSEDHTFVLSVVKADAAAEEERDPARHAARAQKAREKLQAELAASLRPAARKEFLRLAGRAQKYARNRERSKAAWVRGLRLSRPVLLEMARRCASRGLIAEPGDFWYLTYEEARAIFADGKPEGDYRTRIAARKAEKKKMEGLIPPEVFVAPPELTPLATDRPEGGELSGMGVSAGLATGRARVIRSAAAAEEAELHPGEILVAPFTDAAWTPLFVPASAVVVETGGMLSHAATVAREYGIPAVVAVRGATRVIRDGQEITVDGAAGKVRIGA